MALSLCGIELAVGLVGDGHRAEPGTAFQNQLVQAVGQRCRTAFPLPRSDCCRPVVDHSSFPVPLLPSVLGGLGQGLVNIGEDVIDMFNTDGQADHPLFDCRLPGAAPALSWEWVVEAGWMARDLASPTLAR